MNRTFRAVICLGIACGGIGEVAAQGRRLPPPSSASEAARNFRADRAKLAEARTPEACAALAEKLVKAHPAAMAADPPTVPSPAVVRRLESDPEGAFRDAGTSERNSFYRLLIDDAVERSLELGVAANPQEGPDLAEIARKRLPSRKDLPAALLDVAAKSLGDFHQNEAAALARAFETAGRLNGAREVRKRWLDEQREHRLGPEDAEGRVALADQYQSMVGDTITAVALLQDAHRIDPRSPAVASAFTALGYHRAGDRWVAVGTEPTPAEPAVEEPRPVVGEAAGSLIGLTRDQIRRQMGNPSRIARVATQGRVIEQWSYDSDRGAQRMINFLRREPHSEPTAVSENVVH